MTKTPAWPFDQAENVAAISDALVLDGRPVLLVVHYSEDDSWAFLSGEAELPSQGKVIAMREALDIDPSLASIADLNPGWVATRESVGAEWAREPDPDV